jgi:hypothetical protein
MPLETIGAIVAILYIVGIFALQWVSDIYFNVGKDSE